MFKVFACRVPCYAFFRHQAAEFSMSKIFSKNNLRVSNSLDPDQARRIIIVRRDCPSRDAFCKVDTIIGELVPC